MARTKTGQYKQRMLGVSEDTYKRYDALRLKHESWEKFFKRIYPKVVKRSIV